MVKLRLKRCGRKQRATWRTRSAVDSYTHHLFYIIWEWKCSWLDIVCSLSLEPNFLRGCGVNKPYHPWWSSSRTERIDSFLGGKNLRLVSIKKLGQLCNSIFDREIESFQFKQVSNSKVKFFWIGKTLSIKSKVYYTWINYSYDSLI